MLRDLNREPKTDLILQKKELVRKVDLALIPPDLTQDLIESGLNPSPELIQRIESEIQAYLNIFQSDIGLIYGGCTHDNQGRGPEKPYFMPQEDDLNPLVQAVAEIGVQAKYWGQYPAAINSPSFSISNLFCLETLVLHTNSDGSSCVVLDKNNDKVESIAKDRDKTDPSYPHWVPLLNFGGDADFYGPWECRIFPMRITRGDKGSQYVEASSLGIDPDLYQLTWDSWRALDIIHSQLYYQSAILAFNTPNSGIPPFLRVGHFFEEDSVNSHSILTRNFFRMEIEDLRILDLIIQAISDEAMRTMRENGQLLTAAQDHADNLEEMYQVAREHCAEIYPYD